MTVICLDYDGLMTMEIKKAGPGRHQASLQGEMN